MGFPTGKIEVLPISETRVLPNAELFLQRGLKFETSVS